jgi:hypothetical protein
MACGRAGVVLWRAVPRIQEALDLTDRDLDPRRESVLVRPSVAAHSRRFPPAPGSPYRFAADAAAARERPQTVEPLPTSSNTSTGSGRVDCSSRPIAVAMPFVPAVTSSP